MSRTIRGNERTVTNIVCGPDAWARHITQLGLFTNTFSPASKGPGPDAFDDGLPGYGPSRATDFLLYPLQRFTGVASPVRDPDNQTLGYGAGVSGQPGLPSTGNTPAEAALAWMSYNPLGRQGMGG